MFNPNKAKTGKEFIDPALRKAGWDVNNANLVGFEIPIDGTDPRVWATLKAKLDRVKKEWQFLRRQASSWHQRLYVVSSNKEIIAIVEAKLTSINPYLTQTQIDFYIKQLEKRQSFRPFAFEQRDEIPIRFCIQAK